jgi:tetratricopeptide (TPR) repeat protein/tRNA A-37 threonylcarbamoyl transferase component Bud32
VAATGGRIGPGTILRGRYRLRTLLGEGAHGVTYLAEHEYLNHPCVVKVLRHQTAQADDAEARRLRHEASAGFRVNHPSVVRVIDCDVLDGYWFFVMEYVAGLDLGSVREAGVPVDWRQTACIARDAAAGLAAIHAAGLVHRDIKPGNLIIGADGAVRLADLGVVGLLPREERDLAPTGEMVGTLGYAAPESLDPLKPTDHRSDLYSLGATLFEIATRRPFRAAAGVFQTLLEADRTTPVWPTDVPDETPGWLTEAILRMLEPDPAARFGSAELLLRHLESSGGDTGTKASISDRAEPRGVVVLTFEDGSDDAGQSWLGHALADHLASALGRIPAVYVVERGQYTATLERIAARGESRGTRLLRAARLNGAATVIEGEFTCAGQTLTVTAKLHTAAHPAPVSIGSVSGPLASLADLEAELAELVAGRLGKKAPESNRRTGVSASAALAGLESFFSGKRAFFRGDYEDAIACATRAIELDPGFLEAVGFVGVCCARMGRYNEAADHYAAQERLADESGDARAKVEAFANRGAMYYFRGEYELADEYLTRAVDSAETLGLVSEVAQIRNNLGFAQLQLKHPEQAERTFRQAIDTHKALGALVSLVGPYNGLGSVLREQQRYDQAREYFDRARALAQESDDRVNVGVAYMNLGQCAILTGRLTDAKHELALALNLLDDTGFWNGRARVYEFMADLNLRLGNTEEAVRCADRRIELAAKHGNVRMESAAWAQKAKALKLAGRTAESSKCMGLAQTAESRGERRTPRSA